MPTKCNAKSCNTDKKNQTIGEALKLSPKRAEEITALSEKIFKRCNTLHQVIESVEKQKSVTVKEKLFMMYGLTLNIERHQRIGGVLKMLSGMAGER